MYTIPELLNNLTRIQYDQRIFIIDSNYQQWYIEVEESYDEETEECFPNARVQNWDKCYLFSDSTGETVAQAVSQCLYDVGLIDDATYSQLSWVKPCNYLTD